MKRLLSILLAVVLIAMAIPATVSAAGEREYSITITTGDVGTNSMVYVVVIGDSGILERVKLDTSGYDDFEAGATDTYVFRGKDVGNVTKIIIQERIEFNYWEIESIGFEGYTYYYDKSMIKYLDLFQASFPITKGGLRPQRDYTVSLRTADVVRGGSDEKSWIQFIGNKGKTSIIDLSMFGYDEFVRNTVSTFTLTDLDVGNVTGINVFFYDDSDFGDNWFLGSVVFNNQTYLVNQELDEHVVEIRLSSNKGYTVNTKDFSYSKMLAASTFSSPDIWFVVSGGVLMLAVAVFAVIFVQRRKKKAKAMVSDSNDQLNQ